MCVDLTFILYCNFIRNYFFEDKSQTQYMLLSARELGRAWTLGQ